MATILITGTSSGIGFVTVLELARAGHKVFATMRDATKSARLMEIVRKEKLPVEISTLDVDLDESVAQCFAAINEPIDVLVNNAGIERHGSVEDQPMESFLATMNTNYFGAVRCMKAVLPQMREARKGCIINVTSVAGRMAISPLGSYSASKFALEAISETLAGEVKSFGIRVAIVEPGIQDTKMAQAICVTGDSPYCQQSRVAGMFRAALANPVPPETTARIIREIVEGDSWQLRYLSGPDAAPFIAWRAGMTDEQFVDWSALDNDDWYERVQNEFGLNARDSASAAKGD